MVTKNQKIVAEALRLARDVNFHTGRVFLSANMVGDPSVQSKWFANKCAEHNIPITSMDRFTATVSERFTEAVTAFKKFGVSLTDAVKKTQSFADKMAEMENAHEQH